MFRQRDRQSMLFVFDLWDYGHVSEHAHAILARLRAGTMPCDGVWPAGQVEVFSDGSTTANDTDEFAPPVLWMR